MGKSNTFIHSEISNCSSPKKKYHSYNDNNMGWSWHTPYILVGLSGKVPFWHIWAACLRVTYFQCSNQRLAYKLVDILQIKMHIFLIKDTLLEFTIKKCQQAHLTGRLSDTDDGALLDQTERFFGAENGSATGLWSWESLKKYLKGNADWLQKVKWE